jgi:hypothetical protein
VEALKEQLDQARAGAGTPTTITTQGTSTSPQETYTDGTYLVNKEISPGTYVGTLTGTVGYWARLKNTTGMVDGIIANGLERGRFVLTIYPTDLALELRGVTLTRAPGS